MAQVKLDNLVLARANSLATSLLGANHKFTFSVVERGETTKIMSFCLHIVIPQPSAPGDGSIAVPSPEDEKKANRLHTFFVMQNWNITTVIPGSSPSTNTTIEFNRIEDDKETNGHTLRIYYNFATGQDVFI